MSKDQYDAETLQILDDRRLLEKCVLDKKVLDKCNTTKDFWTERFKHKYGIKIENMKNTKYGKLTPYRLYLTMLQEEDILARSILRNVSKYDDRDLIKNIVELHSSILKIGWNFNEYLISEEKRDVGIIVSKNIKDTGNTGIFGIFKKRKEIDLKLYIILNNGWPREPPNVYVLSPEPDVNKILELKKDLDPKKVLDSIIIPMKEFEEFANVYFLKLKKVYSKYNYNFPSLYINSAMYEAARRGDLNEVQNLIEKGAHELNLGMRYAAEGGHQKLVDLFIKKGANNWGEGMYGAAKGGHQKLVDLFIKKGANDWNYGMIGAAEGGNLDLVKFFIKKGTIEWDDLEQGIKKASEKGHLKIIKFLEDERKKYLEELNKTLKR